eukprot:TRINITY_DN19690_c0_g1::TRINITY_DN19690_c0_g1_i1::g.3341::m.3341 TRINITY_DN19690_c0_g1::TRINITY_DN19690_c0_g1_i1::g.3341  ORF type:complete len:123 (-),score=12.07,SieB/PF14163.1/0.21 TRINITY_DN19690_c0_g1_i1:108-476(-)
MADRYSCNMFPLPNLAARRKLAQLRDRKDRIRQHHEQMEEQQLDIIYQSFASSQSHLRFRTHETVSPLLLSRPIELDTSTRSPLTYFTRDFPSSRESIIPPFLSDPDLAVRGNRRRRNSYSS